MNKIDFSNIQVTDIEGKKVPVDIRQMMGNLLYMQGNNITECELGQAIYHQADDMPMELSDEQVAIIKRFAERLAYVTRTAILEALKD